MKCEINSGLGYGWSCIKHDNHPHLGCESWPFWSTLESSFRMLFWGRFRRIMWYSFQWQGGRLEPMVGKKNKINKDKQIIRWFYFVCTFIASFCSRPCSIVDYTCMYINWSLIFHRITLFHIDIDIQLTIWIGYGSMVQLILHLHIWCNQLNFHPLQLIKHLFHTFWLLFRFKSKCGCPITSKITNLYFISNIIQLPRG